MRLVGGHSCPKKENMAKCTEKKKHMVTEVLDIIYAEDQEDVNDDDSEADCWYADEEYEEGLHPFKDEK